MILSSGAWLAVKKKSTPFVARMLIFTLMLGLMISAVPSRTLAAEAENLFDFEAFQTGLLNKQFGWSGDDHSTITDQTAKSGTKSIRIDDNDTTKAYGPYFNFSNLSQGKIEWWAKTNSQVRLITQLQSIGSSTLTAEWMGFNNTGKFVYTDGTKRVDTPISYQLDTWYRFTIGFDAATQKKTLLISDDSGVLFAKKDIAFRDAGISSLNRIRFSTISTEIGMFHVDDVRISDQMENKPSDLIGVRLAPSSLTLTTGQSAQLQTVGTYVYGGINLLNQGNEYASDRPDVASVDPTGLVLGVGSGEATITVTNGVYGASANVIVYGPGEAPPYKPIQPRHLQRDTDLNGITILTPNGPEWAAAGARIADKLKQKWQVNATVAVSDAAQVGEGWAGNTLLLGNLGNNPHIARLYGLYLSYTDADHPGKGGYQLQTVIDPFGKGGNTILLGVSDLAGLNEGTGRLNAILDGLAAPSTPWLSESKLSADSLAPLPYGANPTDADVAFIKQEADALFAKLVPDSSDELSANQLLAVFGKVTLHGRYFQLTNNDKYGEMYRYYWDGYANFLNSHPDIAQAQLHSLRNMWTNGYATIGSYMVMEASPIFTEHDRKKIVSALYLTYEANSHDGYLVGAPETGARYNHDVFPALSIIFGASYFQNYHHLPEVDAWQRLGERIFKGNTSNINLDEGSDYLMHVPGVTLEYAMATGDRRFLAQGLRPSADLNAMMIDNLGTMSGGGDVYPFGRSSAYSWNHSQVMNAASWFFNEPLYQFLLERTKTGPFNGQNMSDLLFPYHRYMTDAARVTELTGKYPMVQSYPVEQGVYDELLLDEKGKLDVPIEETFHKLAFRQGFDVNDSYLMLDGFSAGRHGHMDGNTIIKYSANGRIFIDDRDYIEKAPKNHTGLVVVKDGVQEAKPPLARLEWAADADGIGISRSEMPNYNGVDWTRSIISPGGRFFLIYDDVEMKSGGNYILENTWQTLGDMTIRGDRVEVKQQGAAMSIQSLDDSDQREYERYGHFVKYWKTIYPYPYADEEHVLRQVKEETPYTAGDVSRFVNVLSSKPGEGQQLIAHRLNDRTIRIDEGAGQSWYASWGALTAKDFSSDGKFHLVGPEELLIAETTQVRTGGQTLHFQEPVLFKLHAKTGKWQAFKMTKGMTHYDNEGRPIEDGTVDEGILAPDHKLLQSLRSELQLQEKAESFKKPKPEKESAESDWIKAYEFGQQVTHSSVGDVNGDGMDELLLGGIDGKIQVIGNDGLPLWTFQSKGRVNEVTVQQVNGVPTVFVATENWFVHVLNADGTVKWQTEIPNGPERREMKGNLIGVTNIRVAHINGKEQDPWIMVGTQFRYLYGFDLQGKLQYEDIVYFYGIEDMDFLDLDGDGKDEGFFALEYYYYSFLNDGVLTRYGGTKDPGPGYKVAEPLERWSGSPQAAVVYGTKQNRVHVVQYDGSAPKELWRKNVGGEVNDIAAGDFDNDGTTEILVASDGFQVYLLNEDGSVRWRKTVSDRAMNVTVQVTPDGIQYLAALDNGGLVAFDAQGELLSEVHFKPLIQNVHGTGSGAWTVTETGDIYRPK